jgi:hypothetical protein
MKRHISRIGATRDLTLLMWLACTSVACGGGAPSAPTASEPRLVSLRVSPSPVILRLPGTCCSASWRFPSDDSLSGSYFLSVYRVFSDGSERQLYGGGRPSSILGPIFGPSPSSPGAARFQSSNTGVATVDDHQVRAVAPGQTTILVTSPEGVTATVQVIVDFPVALRISPSPLTLRFPRDTLPNNRPNYGYRFNVFARYSDGSEFTLISGGPIPCPSVCGEFSCGCVRFGTPSPTGVVAPNQEAMIPVTAGQATIAASLIGWEQASGTAQILVEFSG